VANNLGFLKQCIARFALIEFIDRASDSCYLRIRSGSFDVCDADMFKGNLVDETLVEVVKLLAPDLLDPDLLNE